jgi:hypothetical protein
VATKSYTITGHVLPPGNVTTSSPDIHQAIRMQGVGTTIDLNLRPDQEADLVARGSLRVGT